MELVSGVVKEDYSDYILYFLETLSDVLKKEIRSRLVAVCYGVDQASSSSKIYSYKATVKEFLKRYKASGDASEDRKKGMIGELLVHVILEIEGRFTTASPFFNMEERSFKKGFDVSLFEEKTSDLWIAEVKSGKKQKQQATASSAIVGLLNTAKNDLNERLNPPFFKRFRRFLSNDPTLLGKADEESARTPGGFAEKIGYIPLRLREGTEEGDKERYGEIDDDPVKDGDEHQVFPAITGDDRQGGIHRGGSPGAYRRQSAEITDEERRAQQGEYLPEYIGDQGDRTQLGRQAIA